MTPTRRQPLTFRYSPTPLMSNSRATTADGRTSVNEPPLASNCWWASISARSPLESTNSTPLRSISSAAASELATAAGDLGRGVGVDLADDSEPVPGRRDGERRVRCGHVCTVSISSCADSCAATGSERLQRDDRDVVGARADLELGDAPEHLGDELLRIATSAAEWSNSAKRSSPNRWRSAPIASVTPSVYSSNVHPGPIVTDSVCHVDSKAPSNGPVRPSSIVVCAVGEDRRWMAGVGVLAHPGVDVDHGDDGGQEVGPLVLAVLPRQPVERASGTDPAAQRGAQLALRLEGVEGRARAVTGDVDHHDVQTVLVEQAEVEAVPGDDTLGRDEGAAHRPSGRRVAELVGELGANVERQHGALLERAIGGDRPIAFVRQRALQCADGVDDLLQLGAVEIGQLLRHRRSRGRAPILRSAPTAG